MFIKINNGFNTSIENTNSISSICNVGNKLCFKYNGNCAPVVVVEYESIEEATEVIDRIFAEYRLESTAYELPERGFLSEERLLATELSEFSESKNEDGLQNYIIDYMTKHGLITLGDVVFRYNPNPNRLDAMEPIYVEKLREFLASKNLSLVHDEQ